MDIPEKLRRGAMLAVGCFLSAAGVYSFAVAASVPVTGVAGLSAILYHLFAWPIGLVTVCLNVPIILGCCRRLGRAFFVRSVLCMAFYALFSDTVLPLLPVYSGDRLLAAVCGGVVSGLGDALIYRENSSTGGLDFLTMAIKSRRPHLSLGYLTFGATMAVVALHGLIFRDIDAVIYGLVFNYISAAIIDRVLSGVGAGVLALIVTDEGQGVCAAIDRETGRGATILKGYGGWQNRERDVVLCACTSKQVVNVEHAAKATDPGSFIILLPSNEVHGEGFKRLVIGEEH